MIIPLNESERSAVLARLPLWRYDSQRVALYRKLSLGSFARAFGIMTQIAIEAEKLDHHPEWANVYDRLEIWLTTHDASGVTARDVRLAEIIEEILQ